MKIALRAIQLAAVALVLRDLKWRIYKTARRYSIPNDAVRQLERDGRRSFSLLDEVLEISGERAKDR